jgi:hypothetical protein
VKGTYLVYRGSEPLSAQTLDKATKLGEVAGGVQLYLDAPPDRSSYYYAVLLRDAAGTVYKRFIQFRNITSAPVAVQVLAPEQDEAATITQIKAAPAAEGITVTFRSSNPKRDLLLFRGTSPLEAPDDLLGSTSAVQLDAGATSYQYPALAGVDYWFAVVDAGTYKLGKGVLTPGQSSTVTAIRLPLPASASRTAPASSRAQPLPTLALGLDVRTGQAMATTDLPEVPAEKQVSLSTQRAIGALLAMVSERPVAPMKPELLASDATPSPDGELTMLQEIVQGPLQGGDTLAAEKRFRDFLSLRRTADREARARFYLGQTYYFENRARDALLEFLMCEDSFYQQVQRWKDACFAKLEAQER